ncbi:HIT family protein [Gordonia jinhuaensis]|uniref:Hydrolase n=1 Tax=Gordonia jinhuaensis TaxID=1517702 RepID=A0A916T4Y9_9ACTN|nr:HIT family protein [Gordonia jinhuaensis]GGB31000.1 hydrolase [Gordonia jinhuaensis]
MSSDCVFCQIVDDRAPARIVYSDPTVIGFLDIRPVRPGHTLIIPREHHSGLADVPPQTGAAMFAAAQRVAAAMRSSALAADGVNLVVNDGRAAFQTVFHSHLHVVPRRTGDKASLAAGFLLRRDRDPDATAAALRAALDT